MTKGEKRKSSGEGRLAQLRKGQWQRNSTWQSEGATKGHPGGGRTDAGTKKQTIV